MQNTIKMLILGLLLTGSGLWNHGQAQSSFTQATATFAGGCFWCLEPPFESEPGVSDVISGYTGGDTRDPSYRAVGTGLTGHREAVQVRYDPRQVSYERLLEIFWRNIDPTDAGGQFHDRGSQYMTAVFYHDEAQRTAAEKSRRELDHSGKFTRPVVTDILPAGRFYPAEDYHQDYYRKNAKQYQRYKVGSGRAGFIEKNWGKEH